MALEQPEPYQAAISYAERLGVDGLAEVQSGPPRWVFVDNAQQIAVRVAVSSGSESLETLSEEYRLLTRLHDLGAQVMRFAAEPQEVAGFNVYATEYLPGEKATTFSYGQAMASLHNTDVDHEARNLPAFQPLLRTRRAFDYLRGENVHPALLHLVEDELFMQLFEGWLARGEEATEQMLRLAAERGYELAITQQDTHPGNVRVDVRGVATLIDLSGLMLGPAEIDFGRLRQWSYRFGLEPQFAEQFEAGYRDRALRQPDQELIELAYTIADVRYASVAITQAVENLARGIEPNPDKLRQAIDRVTHLDNSYYPWVPLSPLVKPNE